MVSSPALTVKEYLASLPPERCRVISAVRRVIRVSLPKGYRETMNWGAISYEIPLKRYPDTYNGQPLCYAGLAAQKNHYALYLMCLYSNPRLATVFSEQFRTKGKKLDMGKSCVRFRSLEDLDLPAIAKVIAGTSVEQYIELYEKVKKRRVPSRIHQRAAERTVFPESRSHPTRFSAGPTRR